MEQQSNLIIFQVIGTGTSFYLTFFINDLKKQTGSKSCQVCSWQEVKSQASKEKLQERSLVSFHVAENKIMHLGDIPNYMSRTWVMTQKGDPEVMEITSLKVFVVVAAGLQSPRTRLGMVLKTKMMMYIKIIIKVVTIFDYYVPS